MNNVTQMRLYFFYLFSFHIGLMQARALGESLHICQSLIHFQTRPSTKRSTMKSSVDWSDVISSKTTANILNRPRHSKWHGSARNCAVMNKMPAGLTLLSDRLLRPITMPDVRPWSFGRAPNSLSCSGS